MNAKEAAVLLGVHYKTVLNMINDGRLTATKTDSGDWEISESDLAAREQQIHDKEFSAIYAHMAVQMIEKTHNRAVKAAREELLFAARSLVKHADHPSQFSQQAKRLQDALDAFKAAEAFTITVESIRKQAESES
ncbi:excisionase family DNA-binding protein [Paenibacillus sp. VCA1]|uniref:excisionase family DNA-binding protein n=1 Tax=Paenibacillus sp. VCA1 TaxID=3039148 RepID=UPI002871224E|nr:helix-turn-helix domain-containing protein [Paenibacillus sp. VCA1]MDR9854201.1 excisionase family DNA-binding protein [Paenibacillus sp. VCA1]